MVIFSNIITGYVEIKKGGDKMKAKKTFGLAVLLKLAGVKLPEENGEYQILDKEDVYEKCKKASEKHNLKFKTGSSVRKDRRKKTGKNKKIFNKWFSCGKNSQSSMKEEFKKRVIKTMRDLENEPVFGETEERDV